MIRLIALALVAAGPAPAQEPKPVPRMQAVPLPRGEVSLRRDEVELTRFYDGSDARRPFLYPVVGPTGRSLTRMGHPHDPSGHSHHNSVWISHNDVDGLSFWDDKSGRIVPVRVIKLEDTDRYSSVLTAASWVDKAGKPVLSEKRRVTAEDLDGKEWLLTIDLELSSANGKTVTLGKSSFGPIGVRMAKSIGINDGGGELRNSEGNEGEQGPNGVFWKHARWVDYSGPVANKVIEGITLIDHPGNPNHPCGFHVRSDGWMGASLTLDAPLKIDVGKPLRLRYVLYVHSGEPARSAIDAVAARVGARPLEPLPEK